MPMVTRNNHNNTTAEDSDDEYYNPSAVASRGVGGGSWVQRDAPLAPPRRGGQWAKFPEILYAMLTDLDAVGDYNAICWAPHGYSVVFPNKELFIAQYLPLWFRFTTFSSFQRQLNLYGFKRIGDGREKHGYYHDNFRRSVPEIIPEMKRYAAKGTRRVPAAVPPNFYNRESMPPLPDSPPRPIVKSYLAHLDLPEPRLRRKHIRKMYGHGAVEASMPSSSSSKKDASTSSDVSGTNEPRSTPSKDAGPNKKMMMVETTGPTSTTRFMDEARVPPNVTLINALSMQRRSSTSLAVNQALEASCPLRPIPFTATATTTVAVGSVIQPTIQVALLPVPGSIVPLVAGLGPGAPTQGMRCSMESSHLSSRALMEFGTTMGSSFPANNMIGGGCGGGLNTTAPAQYQYTGNCTAPAFRGGQDINAGMMETMIAGPFMSLPPTPVTATRIRQVSNGSRTTTTATLPSPPFLQGTTDNNGDHIAATPAVDAVMSSTTHPGQQGDNNVMAKDIGGRHPGMSPVQPQEEDNEAKMMIPERVESIVAPPLQNAVAAVGAPDKVNSCSSNSNDSRKGDAISNAVTATLAKSPGLNRFDSGEVLRSFDQFFGGDTNENDLAPIPFADSHRATVPAKSTQEVQEDQRFNGNDAVTEAFGRSIDVLFDHYGHDHHQDPFNDSVVGGSGLEDDVDPLHIDDLDTILFS